MDSTNGVNEPNKSGNVILILVGPPGSGKGTQASILSKKFNLVHFSTGECIRDMIARNVDEALEIASYANSGKLAPDHLVNKISARFLSETVGEPSQARPVTQSSISVDIIMDGYPRNLEQAHFFASELSKYRTLSQMVLYFDIKEEEVIRRICGRFSCKNCGQIYNEHLLKPIKANICDKCGGADFVKRKDDKIDVVKNRMNDFYNQTYKILDFYKQQGGFYTIDASLESSLVTSLVIEKYNTIRSQLRDNAEF